MESRFWSTQIDSWNDLFALLDKQNRQNRTLAGKYFEHFAKHFFLSNPRVSNDYKNVWLQSEVPVGIKRKMSLSANDFGYDLVAERFDGKFAVIQCKFTSQQDKTLGWTSSNLSSWLAISSKADIRILFTNASEIDPTTREKASEKEFYEYNLASLLELSRTEILLVLNSLRNKPSKAEKFTPKKHQTLAIDAVVNGFISNDRGKLILPCGAGKTLTSLWIKEKLTAKTTLVLVPSLALLRQFKNDWKSQESTFSEYLCVCSEKDIDRGGDMGTTHLSELGGRVTTDPLVIKTFLVAKGSVQSKVIYSTYQSSPQIAHALKNSNFEFELIICDEAHRTSGTKEGAFSLVLDGHALKASKRLFMTATPKIVSEMVKDRLGENYIKYLADMNDEAAYGPEFFHMSFADAIKMGILVDYKIIAIGVADTELQKAITARKFAKDTPALYPSLSWHTSRLRR